MESSTYPDRKYIESSRMWVNVAAHRETGHEVDAVIGAKKVTVCDRYWNLACAAHSTAYSDLGRKYEGITGMPTTVYADPEGKELAREVGGKGASELVKLQEGLLAKIPGEKISIVEWNAAKKLLEEADEAFAKSQWKKAIETFTKVSKFAKKALKEKGNEGLVRVEAKGAEMVADAKKKLESEKEEALKILKSIAADFKPLGCAKEAAALLKEAEGKK